MQHKVHTTALCFQLENGELFDAVQNLRYQYDKQINRWPPHINLLYPFVPRSHFSEAAEKIQLALENSQPFQISFEKIGYFQHRYSATAWIKPKNIAGENNSLQQIQQICESVFPFCNDQSKRRSGFVPHMTIGQFQNQEEIKNIIKQVNWKPLNTTVTHLCLISRKGKDDPFEIYYRIPLGGGDIEKIK
jgi:poly(A) polymerase